MSVTIQITEGWTEEIGPFVLLANGAPVDLTDAEEVVLQLREVSTPDTFVDTDEDVRIDADPTTGRVYYTPDADDFVATRAPYTKYQLRWKLTLDGKDSFFPSGEPDYVNVWKA
jgi:hypothetical protein